MLDDGATKSVREAKELGKKQYETFVTERLKDSKKSLLYDNINKNNLLLFRCKNTVKTTKAKQKIVSLDSERRLYASLYVASQSRQGDLDNFFAHENHSYPVSISEYGTLRKCVNKADFLKCLETVCEPLFEAPNVSAKIIDGAAFVNMNARSEAVKNIWRILSKGDPTKDRKRLDIIFADWTWYLTSTNRTALKVRRGSLEART